MKNWLSFIIYVFALLALSSCSQSFYQFPIYSAQHAELGKLDELVMKGEKYDLGFSFYGHDTPLQIRVHNKSNDNLVIDWRNAVISINGQIYELYSKMSKTWICDKEFDENFSKAPDTISISAYEKMVINHGIKSIGDTINSIRPNETLIFNSIEIQKDTLSVTTHSDIKKHKGLHLYRFPKEDSPITLGLSLPIKSKEKIDLIEDTFWISELYKIDQQQFDTPYLHKKSMNMATIYSYSEKKVLKASAYYLSSFIVGYTAIVMSRGASVDPAEIGD